MEMKVSKVELKQEKRRAEILQRVVALLKTTPFEEITVLDICRASDISVGSFYHYFGQKSNLLSGLFGLIDLYMVDVVFPKLTSARAYENLITLSRGFAAYVEQEGIELSRVISTNMPPNYDATHKERPLYLKLTEIVSGGQLTHEFTSAAAPEKIADLLMVAMSGVTVDWSRRDGSYSLTERMDEFTALFFPALLQK
jgi:AcrR family transcriptional regulator